MDEEYDPLNAPLNQYGLQEEYAPEDFPEDTFEEDLATRLYEENLPEGEEEDVGEAMMEGMEIEDEGMLEEMEEEMEEAEMEEEDIDPLYAPLNEYGPQEEYAPEDFPEDNFEEELAERLYEKGVPGEVVGEEMEGGEFEGGLEEELQAQGVGSPESSPGLFVSDEEVDFDSMEGEIDYHEADYQDLSSPEASPFQPNPLPQDYDRRTLMSQAQYSQYMGVMDVGAGEQDPDGRGLGTYYAGPQDEPDRLYYDAQQGNYPATSTRAAGAHGFLAVKWQDSEGSGNVWWCDVCGARFSYRDGLQEHMRTH
jgi:hypothetical protein